MQARITKSSPSAAWKTLVSGTVKLFHKFEEGHPRTRVLNERGVVKICDFLPLSCCISNSNLGPNNNSLIVDRKLYTGSRLTSNSMTLNDLALARLRIGGFMDFLAILGCDTSLYHSQGGASELLLCNPDTEFGTCILT